MITAGTVTWTLIHSARPIEPGPSAVLKPSQVNDFGHAAVPFAEMSSNDRNASTSTKSIGSTQMIDTGISTRWKTQPRRRRPGLGGEAGGAGRATSGRIVAVMVEPPSCLDLVLRGPHQVSDDEDQREREDDHGD